ncbi:MAG TPA: DHH family phosphoesterase [bacterium]|nr:DHH family phosphoesterase [bacterium]
MKITEMSRTRLRRLLRALGKAKRVLILTHDYPDPDAIASALALKRLLERRLGAEVDIGYGGIVGRAENRALVKAVRANLKHVDDLDFPSYGGIALVDTQPRTGNNSLPAGRVPDVVIDHHPLRRETRRVRFKDIRTRFGATATMVLEYLRAARLRLDTELGTALFYGLKAETQGLSREASPRDREAYTRLLPYVDFRKVFEIEYAGVSRRYFGLMGEALAHTTLYGDVAVTSLGEISNPDFCAEFCDMILRLESLRWALCIGHRSGIMYLSLRTRDRNGHAGRTIARIVGREGKAGGHGMMAGGIAQIEKFDPPLYDAAFAQLVLRYLDVAEARDREAEPLLNGTRLPELDRARDETEANAPVS